MIPICPRRISDLRRVTVPTRAGREVGVQAGARVVFSVDRRDSGVLVLRPARDPQPDYGIRDARRARTVSDTGQVTVPAALLDEAGLAVGGWVAFTSTGSALRLFSAERVRGPERRPA